MKKRSLIWGGMTALTVLLGLTSNAAFAQETHQDKTHSTSEQTGEFQHIEQPLWLKGAVTTGGLGLIGLELWWFVFSKPKSRQAATQGDL
jgi:plastocyanin domain-containing protein